MEKIGYDTALEIISFLDLRTIYSLSLTQQLFRLIWEGPALWHLILHRGVQATLRLVTDPSYSIKKFKRLKAEYWTPLRLRDPYLFYKSVSACIQGVSMIPLEALAESSHDFDQDMTRTVNLASNSFWSSAGSARADANEFLRYALSCPAFVGWVGVRLFRANYQGGVLYPPMQYQVKIGMEDNQWDYVSDPIGAVSTESEQLLIVLPGLILGRYLHVELIGKQQTQSSDNLYYVAIESVRCVGLPLSALPAEILESPVQVGGASVQAITESNFPEKLEMWKANPDLVTNESLEVISDLGKLPEYFTQVTQVRTLNKYETYYYLKHLPPDTEERLIAFNSFSYSEEIGDLLYEMGLYHRALSVYGWCRVIEKVYKTLLRLGRYRECTNLASFTGVTLDHVVEIARSLGDTVAEQFDAYMQTMALEEEEDEEGSDNID